MSHISPVPWLVSWFLAEPQGEAKGGFQAGAKPPMIGVVTGGRCSRWFEVSPSHVRSLIFIHKDSAHILNLRVTPPLYSQVPPGGEPMTRYFDPNGVQKKAKSQKAKIRKMRTTKNEREERKNIVFWLFRFFAFRLYLQALLQIAPRTNICFWCILEFVTPATPCHPHNSFFGNNP